VAVVSLTYVNDEPNEVCASALQIQIALTEECIMTEIKPTERRVIPRDKENDYTEVEAVKRRDFIREQTGATLSHVSNYAFDPSIVQGNIENFIGVAQVPIGLAGPLRINGEHAVGDFYIPMATTEGTLVASFNRGMRLMTECGGVKTTVVDSGMQRAPVFIFEDALQAREFGRWVDAHFEVIKAAAETTTRFGKLESIQQFAVGPLRYLRCNYATGDAAGQNMVGKATQAACQWIKQNYPRDVRYILSGNVETDKKHSRINMLLTRGRRVVAETVLRRDIMKAIMGVDIKDLFAARQISMTGAFLAGSANNSAHTANGLAAMFIATGQDAADVAESHASISYAQLLDNGDLYWSITLPALIVGTHGGGTGLATQQECLAMLGCTANGSADKLAEICGAVVLAGEASLASAVLHGDWVPSHDRLGRHHS
jgi:hydroxymethylglutaryl-CoA reductase (NADPH)